MRLAALSVLLLVLAPKAEANPLWYAAGAMMIQHNTMMMQRNMEFQRQMADRQLRPYAHQFAPTRAALVQPVQKSQVIEVKPSVLQHPAFHVSQ